MGNQVQTAQPQTIKGLLSQENVKARFTEILGKNAPAFISSVITAVSNSSLLQRANPQSIMMAAAQAAALNLSVNGSLGQAALVPYNSKNGCEAQFQIMTRGLIQLAMRSGQFKTITNEVVYDGQLVKADPFKGEYEFDCMAKKSNTTIGYMAHFELLNGFQKTTYWTIEQVQEHAKRYSKTFGSNYSPWATNFDAMALKTVLKNLLNKFAPLSIDMQKAMIFDGAMVKGDINNIEEATADYGNEVVETEAEVVEKTQETANKIMEKVKSAQAQQEQPKETLL